MTGDIGGPPPTWAHAIDPSPSVDRPSPRAASARSAHSRERTRARWFSRARATPVSRWPATAFPPHAVGPEPGRAGRWRSPCGAPSPTSSATSSARRPVASPMRRCPVDTSTQASSPRAWMNQTSGPDSSTTVRQPRPSALVIGLGPTGHCLADGATKRSAAGVRTSRSTVSERSSRPSSRCEGRLGRGLGLVRREVVVDPAGPDVVAANVCSACIEGDRSLEPVEQLLGGQGRATHRVQGHLHDRGIEVGQEHVRRHHSPASGARWWPRPARSSGRLRLGPGR